MRIALVGPTHPFKGGIAQHTTQLARLLGDRGAATTIVSWYRQYPARLYPGVMSVPLDQPEVAEHPDVRRVLAWYRPDTWLRAARRLRDVDAVVFVVVTPIQLIAYRLMAAVIGRRARIVALVHNVLPHEPTPVDRPLMRLLLRRADAVLTHTDTQAVAARGLGARSVVVQTLPPNVEPRPVRTAAHRSSRDDPLEVLCFGLVRPYKGVDVLIRAVAQVPSVRLTVAGEFWVPEAELRALAESLGAAERVRFVSGYVPIDQVAALYGASHLAAMPYRSATGSGNIRLAIEHRVPVVVTRVGDLPDAVADGVGLVCEPDDVDSLRSALAAATDPEELSRLQAAVASRESTFDEDWRAYTDAVLACVAR